MNSVMNNSTLISNSGGGSLTYYGGSGAVFDMEKERLKLHKYLRIKEKSQ